MQQFTRIFQFVEVTHIVMHSRFAEVLFKVISSAHIVLSSLALAVLMMRYDPIRYDDSSIKLDGLTARIHALLYADDSSMVSKTALKISERLTQFEKACLEHADMVISHPKTFCMLICKMIEVNSTKSSEY